MDNDRIFYTIRETARTGLISEHSLRLMRAQRILPGIEVGNKFMVNLPLLREKLNELSTNGGAI